MTKENALQKIAELNRHLRHGQWKLISMTVPGCASVFYHALNTVSRKRIELGVK